MTSTQSRGAEASIYQIKVTLEGIRPPVWRRLLVPGEVALDELHDILQAAFGWLDYHLHQFIVGERYFGVPDPDYETYMEMNDEAEVTLGEIAAGEGFRFRYEYDFGDSWMHLIQVEKILPPDPDRAYPVCIKGRRASPPEDVGGVWGYEGFLEAIADPEHEEHESYLEWIGGEFDPEAFDLAEVNAALAALYEGPLWAQVIPHPEGAELRVLRWIDRGVAIVRPKQPFLDWINDSAGFAEPVTFQDLMEDCTAILVPDLDTLDETREFLEPMKPMLLELELDGWIRDRSEWPEERTGELFDAWFDIEVHSMVWDVLAGPLPKEGTGAA